jgi:two-component system nitrate/nitrite response regulator NarL
VVERDANTATALVSALRLAREHGGADAALQALGIAIPDNGRFDGLADDVTRLDGRTTTLREALALGFLAGRVTHGKRGRVAAEPTAFMMDRDLLVSDAQGESIMRLPWFDDGLFVGRQLPDISEMPVAVRRLCVDNYSAALAGERSGFSFTSYGHSYSVDAVPVHGEDGGVEAVLAVALPVGTQLSSALGYERTAARLDATAEQAEQRAELHRAAGRAEAASADRQTACNARRAAARARASALCLRDRNAKPPVVTPRETEVLQLASHGLGSAAIAEQLSVTVATIRTHLENVYPKLGVSDKAAAVATALRHGLID